MIKKGKVYTDNFVCSHCGVLNFYNQQELDQRTHHSDGRAYMLECKRCGWITRVERPAKPTE